MSACGSVLNSHRPALKISQNIVRTISSRTYGLKPYLVQSRGTHNAALSVSKTPKEISGLESVKSEVLTLLHKTAKILPRLQEFGGTSDFSRIGDTTKTWESILSHVHEDLSATTERPARIVVYGLDEWSGTQDFVTALLADPLASKEQNDALEGRWKGRSQSTINIKHVSHSDSAPSPFQLSSNYLTQFPIPLEITEFRPPNSTESDSSSVLSQILSSPTIWEADIPVIICNPLTTPLSSILNAHLPTNTIVVLSASIASNDLDAIIKKYSSRSSRKHTSPLKVPKIISINPSLALKSIRALQADPGSYSAIQKYQAGVVASRLADMTQAIQMKLTRNNPNIPAVRTSLALNHISDALHHSLYIIQQIRREMDNAYIDASRLEETIQEAQTRAAVDVFKQRDPSTGKVVLDEVEEATKDAEKKMKYLMDKLTWWVTIWKIDEITTVIASALTKSWCHGLERKLVLQTGQLTTLQSNLTQSAFTLLATHPTLSMAVLKNTMLQQKGSAQYSLTPESLTRPLSLRRDQIIAYPTTRLHATGQRTLLGMSGGILSGFGISWAGWLGWLVGSGEGLLGFVGLDASTATGLGMLTVAASIRWAMGRWEKSKRTWWQDWARAVDGLDRDLKTTLSRVMEQQVVVVAETASTEITSLINRREEQLAKVGIEVEKLQGTLTTVAHGIERRP